MCGRYQLALSGLTIATLLEVEYAAGAVQPPTWNAAPGQAHPILALDEARGANTVLRDAMWGITVPQRSDGRPARTLANARAETVAHRSLFRRAAHEARACSSR